MEGGSSGWRDWVWSGVSMDDGGVTKTGEGKVVLVCIMVV